MDCCSNAYVHVIHVDRTSPQFPLECNLWRGGELSYNMVVNTSVEVTKLPSWSTYLHGFNVHITSSYYTKQSSLLKQILAHVHNQPYFSSGFPVDFHPRIRFLTGSILSSEREISQPLWHLTVSMSSDTLSDRRVFRSPSCPFRTFFYLNTFRHVFTIIASLSTIMRSLSP